MMTNNISIYVHIPFCVKKCDYCAFYSISGATDETKEKYFQGLIKQIDVFETGYPVSTIYFGGGTPPVLGIERLSLVLERLKEKFNIKDDCEITVEVNPKTVDLDDLIKLRKAGFNRLSIGIQSASDRILGSIGRIHTFEEGKKCIRDGFDAGFENISADVIFALPDQNVEEFKNGVIEIAETGVQHISAYSLQLEEGTPLFQRRTSLSFPDEDEEESQYNALWRILTERGFEHYEISSFAKKGFRSRHNMNYWARGEYVGFGAAAHSFYIGKRFSAPADIEYYIENSGKPFFGVTDFNEAEIISREEAEEERIMLGLRTADGALIPEKAFPQAETIARLGFGAFENGILRLNSKGFRVSNEIIGKILV